MKKCPSCGTLLNEGYRLCAAMSWPVSATVKTHRGLETRKILGYACPQCGRIEFYLQEKH